MTSKNVIFLIVAAAILSALATSLLLRTNNKPTADDGTLSTLLARVEQLEKLLDEEQIARIKLQTQINQDSASPSQQITAINAFTNTESAELNRDDTGSTEPESQQSQERSQAFDIERFRAQRRAQSLPEARKRRLLSAGFAEDEANLLIQSESDVQLQALYDDHDAQRQALQNSDIPPRTTAAERLRDRVGDDVYERYLKANNRSTAVSISNVLGSSPAENAGLQSGDNITSYAGERVFNVRDLNRLTVQGEVGESVLLEVERNGEPLQLTIPRGPVGINSARGR